MSTKIEPSLWPQRALTHGIKLGGGEGENRQGSGRGRRRPLYTFCEQKQCVGTHPISSHHGSLGVLSLAVLIESPIATTDIHLTGRNPEIIIPLNTLFHISHDLLIVAWLRCLDALTQISLAVSYWPWPCLSLIGKRDCTIKAIFPSEQAVAVQNLSIG